MTQFLADPIEAGIAMPKKIIDKYVSHTAKYELPKNRMDLIIKKNPKSRTAEFLTNIITLLQRVRCYHAYLKEIRRSNRSEFKRNRGLYRSLIVHLQDNLPLLLTKLEQATAQQALESDKYITSFITFVYPIFELFGSISAINAPQLMNLPRDKKRKKKCQSLQDCTDDQTGMIPYNASCKVTLQKAHPTEKEKSECQVFRGYDCKKKKTENCIISKYKVLPECYNDRFDNNLRYNREKNENEWVHVIYPALIQQSIFRFDTLISDMIKDRKQKITRGQNITSSVQSLSNLTKAYTQLKSFLIEKYTEQIMKKSVQKSFQQFLKTKLISYPKQSQARVQVIKEAQISPQQVQSQKRSQDHTKKAQTQLKQDLTNAFQILSSERNRQKIRQYMIGFTATFPEVDPDILSHVLSQSPDKIKNVNAVRAVKEMVRKIPDAQKRKALNALIPDDKTVLRAALESIRVSRDSIDPVLAWASEISIPVFKTLLSDVRDQDKDLFRTENVKEFVDHWISETLSSRRAEQRASLQREMAMFRIRLIPRKDQQKITQGRGMVSDKTVKSQQAIASLIAHAKRAKEQTALFQLLEKGMALINDETLPPATRRRLEQSILSIPKSNIDKLLDNNDAQKAKQNARRYDEVTHTSLFPKYVPYVISKLQARQSKAELNKRLADMRNKITGNQAQQEDEEFYQDE